MGANRDEPGKWLQGSSGAANGDTTGSAAAASAHGLASSEHDTSARDGASGAHGSTLGSITDRGAAAAAGDDVSAMLDEIE